MIRTIQIFIVVLLINACSSSKNYLERSDTDKALQDAVKKLSKSNSDEDALQAIPVLYKELTQNHLGKIKSFINSKEPARWDKILREYNYLQDAYDAIINSPAAFKLVNPVSYSTQILETKQLAAEEYYLLAQGFYNLPGRDNAKKAYNHFKKVNQYIPGYKNAQSLMDQAYENAIINVIVNPVQDNSFFSNNGWGNTGYNYSNEYFQQSMIRDLKNNSNRSSARFYSEWDARRENIKPDWVVDLRLRNMDIPYPLTSTYAKNVNGRVQAGTDSSGNPLFNTVYATINITRMSFTARADMEVNIKDVVNGKNISYRTFRDDYRWQQERATFTGDSRALSPAHWQLINANNYGAPQKEEILSELYRKIYPQVKNNISNAVAW